MMRVGLLVIFAVLIGSAIAESLRGATPEFEKIVSSSSSIKCDGGKKTIKKEYINDDYCDCEDGSDEPGTSACANAKFFCRNSGHLPLTIPSQWVDDGHCDCCDGSDESSGKCPNTCAAAAAEFNKRVLEQQSTVEAGLRVRARYVESAKKAKETKQARLVELESTVLPAAELKVRELEAQKERVDNELKVLQDEVDAVKNAREEERKKKEEAAAAEGATEQQQADHIDPEHQADHEEALGNPEDDPEYKKAKEKRDSLDATLTDARNDRDAATREIDEIKKFMTLDFGRDDAFYGNYGQSYEYNTHEYTYELKPFQGVYQKQSGRHTRMGDWEAWKGSNHEAMMYSKGEHCWGGPDRSCKVVIKCGPEPRVLDVKEPAKCEYEMQFETPAACDPDMLKTL